MFQVKWHVFQIAGHNHHRFSRRVCQPKLVKHIRISARDIRQSNRGVLRVVPDISDYWRWTEDIVRSNGLETRSPNRWNVNILVIAIERASEWHDHKAHLPGGCSHCIVDRAHVDILMYGVNRTRLDHHLRSFLGNLPPIGDTLHCRQKTLTRDTRHLSPKLSPELLDGNQILQ